jgi:hypothetical protein
MAKGASVAVFRFTGYEGHLIERIDRDSVRKRELVIKTTEALRLTTCSIITRKRRRKCKKV